MKKVSIVMGVYNGESTLADALETILMQTYTNFELIVVDDGSSDGSSEILQQYACREMRIRILTNRNNIGLAKSLNRGILVADGSYILRMDQDDLSLSDRLMSQVNVLDAHPEVGLVSCFVDPLFSPDASDATRSGVRAFEDQRRTLARTPEKIPKALEMSNVFHHGEVLYRRDVCITVGGYRPTFAMSEDYDLWLRMVGYTKFQILPRMLYIRRHGQSNNSHKYRIIQDFTAELAKDCHRIRLSGQDDHTFAEKAFQQFIMEQGLQAQFGR